MKKLVVAFSLLLATGYVANNVYAAVNTTVKTQVEKDKDKDKKKKKSSCSAEEKKGSCSSSTSTQKSCCSAGAKK